jgi:hypothetical protein
MAMVVMRFFSPASKLAATRMLDAATAATSLVEVLELGDVDENELYAALDWLGERQEHVEKALARKHLHDATLALDDVSPCYVEERCCKLGAVVKTRSGYNRDGEKGKLQIVYGLLCAPEAVRWRSKCLKAIPPIPTRSARRSTSPSSASA